MSQSPEQFKFATTHEWVFIDADGIAFVGISDFAQDELGDIVFLELPEPETHVSAGQACATVESVKTASDIHSPINGTVVESNQDVTEAPESVNEDAYSTWLFKIKPDDPNEIEQLLDLQGYQDSINA